MNFFPIYFYKIRIGIVGLINTKILNNNRLNANSIGLGGVGSHSKVIMNGSANTNRVTNSIENSEKGKIMNKNFNEDKESRNAVVKLILKI